MIDIRHSSQNILNILHITSTKTGTLTMITSRAAQDEIRIEENLNDGAFGIHVVAERSMFDCKHRFFVNRSWAGGKDDWLVTTDLFCDMQLINPITGDVVPLPSLTTVQDLQFDKYQEQHIIYKNRHIFRRVALCQTPSSPNGHFAIALFDDGFMACTSHGHSDWKLFTHPTQLLPGCYTNYPEAFLDAIVYHARVVAVNERGFMYSWSMDDPEAYPIKIEPPEFTEEYDCRVYYLATSPSDQLLLICVHGEYRRFYEPNLRMVVSEHDRIEQPAGISIHVYDDTQHVWRRKRSIGSGLSLFLGLNYPFYGRWNKVKADKVYIANMSNIDSMIFSMDSEAENSIEKQDYPIEEASRLLDGMSIRTPMWFRPTAPPLTGKKAYNK